MFNSMSALSSSSTSDTSNSFNSSTSTETESKKVLSVIQNSEEKMPLLAEGEAEKKLAPILTQVRRNEVSLLNFSGFGRFIEETKPVYTSSERNYSVLR